MGFTTSGCHSPALGSGLAMASVPVQLSAPGTRLQVSDMISVICVKVTYYRSCWLESPERLRLLKGLQS